MSAVPIPPGASTRTPPDSIATVQHRQRVQQRQRSSLMVPVVVLSEQVFAEIVGGVTPDGVDVVGVVLGVVKLDQERRPVHAVVMPLPRLHDAGPGEMNLLEPGFVDF